MADSRLQIVLSALGLAAALAAPAFAGAVGASDMHEYAIVAAAETHQPLRVKNGKPVLMQTEADIGSVTVDAGKAVAFAQGPKTVAVFPKGLGASHVVVRDKEGQVAMARYVFSVDPAKKYVKLKQPCADNAGAACERIYFCPNLCYQTHIVAPPPPLKE